MVLRGQEPDSWNEMRVNVYLLPYGSDHEGSLDGTVLDFTVSLQANDLLRHDSFAFLLGVLFDQNIPAERGVGRAIPTVAAARGSRSHPHR